MTTYSHVFTIAFSVSESTDPIGENVTIDQLRAALEKRITDLNFEGDTAWYEAVGIPNDTYEE